MQPSVHEVARGGPEREAATLSALGRTLLWADRLGSPVRMRPEQLDADEPACFAVPSGALGAFGKVQGHGQFLPANTRPRRAPRHGNAGRRWYSGRLRCAGVVRRRKLSAGRARTRRANARLADSLVQGAALARLISTNVSLSAFSGSGRDRVSLVAPISSRGRCGDGGTASARNASIGCNWNTEVRCRARLETDRRAAEVCFRLQPRPGFHRTRDAVQCRSRNKP